MDIIINPAGETTIAWADIAYVCALLWAAVTVNTLAASIQTPKYKLPATLLATAVSAFMIVGIVNIIASS